MPLPCISLPDPKLEAEGTIDPLGLAVIADRLADDMLPGLRARMSRPRFLTAIAVSSAALEDLEPAKDGTLPSIALEWIAVQAFALLDEEIQRIPGMLKAKSVLRDGAPMSRRRYLVNPAIFGFHGVYRTLAIAIGIVDDDYRLRPAGERLVEAWSKAEHLDGFLCGTESTAGGAVRRRLRLAIAEALSTGLAEKPKRDTVLDLFQQHLRPDRIPPEEARVLRDLITSPSGGTRGEVFSLFARGDTRKAYADLGTERSFLGFGRNRASPEYRATLEAIEAFEAVATVAQGAFNAIRHLSTKRKCEALEARAFSEEGPKLLPPRFSEVLSTARSAASGRSAAGEIDRLAHDLDGVRTHDDLFVATLVRHEQTQRRKPPQGKRSWFERTAKGGVFVRPDYRLEQPADLSDRFVHGYRSSAVMSFLEDLGAMQ